MIKNNKLGVTQEFVGIVIGVVLVSILMIILIPGVWNSVKSIFIVTDKYVPAKLNYSNTFLFTAEQISIPDPLPTWCRQGAGKGLYSCDLGATIPLNVNVFNGGLKMRTFYAAPKACRLDSNSKCDPNTILDLARSGTECVLTPNQRDVCTGASATFSIAGIYEVFPGAACQLDATYGCYSAGMTQPVESVNQNNYLTITVKAK